MSDAEREALGRWRRLNDLATHLDKVVFRELQFKVLEPILADICGGHELDELEQDMAAGIYEELVWLAGILDQAVSAVSARISDQVVLDKIAILRNTSGRTPEEAKTAQRIADKLEWRLKNRVEAAGPAEAPPEPGPANGMSWLAPPSSV
jgi:hypothetical protein